MTTKFCTVQQVKYGLDLDPAYTAVDDFITFCIQSATALIRQYTRRNWDYAARIQYASVPNVDRLLNVGRQVWNIPLDEKPCDPLVPPVVTYSRVGDFVDSIALPTNYFQYDATNNKIVIYPTQIYNMERGVQINYTAGFKADVTDPDLCLVSSNIANACAIQAAHMVKRVRNQSTGNEMERTRINLIKTNMTASGLIVEAAALLRGEVRLFGMR